MTRAVLVTGAADGLGLAIAARFAAIGDRVAMLDVNRARLDAAAERLRANGGEVTAITVDVSDPTQVDAAVRAAAERYGPLDVAVSNAGIAPTSSILDMTPDEWRRVMSVNLDGTFYLTRAVAANMVAHGRAGRICCVASGAYKSGRVGAAHYCASKAGVVMYAKVLAMELGQHGIAVNVVAPGFIDHGYRDGLGQFVTDDYVAAMRAATPLGRDGTPDDVADAVEFLCSPGATHVSGAVLAVDGASSAGKYQIPWATSATA